MESIPLSLSIYSFTISTFGIFLFISLALMFFVVWKEGVEDGFDSEKMFDMFITSLFFGIVLSRVFYAFNHALSSQEFFGHIYKFWVPGFNLLGGVIGFLVPVFVFSRIWNWSIYRLLDIFSLGSSLSLSIVALSYIAVELRFELLFAFAAWVLLFVLLTKLRNTRVSSGYTFSIFLVISSILKFIFFKEDGDLNFIVALVTLSLVVFIFRWRLTSYGGTHIRNIIERVKDQIIKQKRRITKS